MTPWWKLSTRPKADAYTTAGLQFILATLAATGALINHAPPIVRGGAVAALACAGIWNCWRAYKLPPDKPEDFLNPTH